MPQNYNFNVFIGNKEVFVNKCILSMSSEVFAAMFQSDMEEKQKNYCIIEDIESNVFEELIHYIYTQRIGNIKPLASNLLTAAEKYGIGELKSICEVFVLAALTDKNAIETLLIADQNNCIELKNKVIAHITNNLSVVIEMDGIY